MDFSFSLPFCLRLPDGEYEVKISDNEFVKLILTKKLPTKYDDRMGIRGLTPDDLKDASVIHLMSLVDGRLIEASPDQVWKIKEPAEVSYYIGKTDGQNHDFEHPVLINSELIRDRLGRFRYTYVTVVYEGKDDVIRIAVDAVNKLIDHYRIFSNHYWVNRITPDDIKVYYTEGGKQRSYSPTVSFQPDIEQFGVESIMKFIKSDSIAPAFYISRLDAKNAFELEDYRLAIVLSIMAIESLVKTFLAFYSQDMEISEACEKRLFDELSLYYLVNRIVRCILPEEFTADVLKKFDRVNQRRNDIIHGAFDPTIGHAREAIELADEFFDILLKRM